MSKNGIEIKGKNIGQGKPMVCVPVMERKKEDILSEVTRLVDLGAEMIEWRVDAFEDVSRTDAVREILACLSPIIENTVFLFTFRSKKQGGLLELDYEKIRHLHQVAAESKTVDLIDVEYFEAENVSYEINVLQDMGVKVIVSHHDFCETPPQETIDTILEQMAKSDADIVKIALMPQSTEDVLLLLEKTNAFHKKYPDQLLITMSMGNLGVISRISGEVFGSCVTFGSGKVSSAPGQIPMLQLQQILDAIHG